MADELFVKNIPALSKEEQLRLSSSVCLLCGCGGLGCSVAEYLLRAGVGKLIVYDGDRFAVSNRNRQLLATEDTVGVFKAEALKKRAALINPAAAVEVHTAFLTAENAADALKGVDLVLDCLDNVPDRLMLEHACAAENLPLVHGAVEGWCLQAGVIPPGSGVLSALYANGERQAARGGEIGALSFTCGICAGIQSAEAIKLLAGRAPSLKGRVLAVDLEDMTSVLL